MKNDLLIGRRAFLRGSTLVLGAGLLEGPQALELLAEQTVAPILKIGLVTDVHYADKAAANNRYYRESLAKLRESIDQFIAQEADFMVELGDLIDSADSFQSEIGHLEKMKSELARFKRECFYVFGNHCVSMLTKAEFLRHFGTQSKETYYSFDRGPFHFIFLDACFRSDGEPYARGNFAWTDTEIPAAQQDWLRDDLRKANKPSLVFVHQRLDVENHYAIRSAVKVREILENSGQVQAVIQGHSHKNDYREIGGIHYCTLRAMVEGSGPANSGYSLLNFFPDGTMHLAGFRQQTRREFTPKARKPEVSLKGS